MKTTTLRRLCDYRLLFAAGVALLAAHPVLWLVGTWIDPTYDSAGILVAVLAAALMGWSASSPRIRRNHSGRRYALALLALTAGIRLLGQILGVNVIGAVALVVDVYALGLLLGINQRQRPLAAGWLAVLFAFSLPLERILQRTIGFGLQQISAAGACRVLTLGADPVQCEGVRILLEGRDVLVDLPCSGARGLLLLLLLFAALAALTRPTPARALAGFCLALAAAGAANVIRIVLLALGLAYPHALAGISVMEAPWHEMIGFFSLGLGAVPILIWAATVPVSSVPTAAAARPTASLSIQHSISPKGRRPLLLGLGFAVGATVIVTLPARPIDVARTVEPINLPLSIAGLTAVSASLSAQEHTYFTRYGGSAARALYGPYALLVVSTSAPLRHLHAPDECLTGSGHQVRYLGARYQGLPYALYRSTDSKGNTWRVAVTFVSTQGELATSVTEAVWRWLQNPSSTWTMVQRIAPWDTPQSALAVWDRAVARALDLAYQSTLEI